MTFSANRPIKGATPLYCKPENAITSKLGDHIAITQTECSALAITQTECSALAITEKSVDFPRIQGGCL